MYPGRSHRGGDVHVKYHGIQQRLQHGGDNQRPTRAACSEPGLTVFENQSGGHRGEGPPARCDGVGLTLHQTVGIRGAGLGGKVIHLVIEQHAGAGHHDVRAEAEVEGVGVSHHIAVSICYRVMGGVGALIGYRVAGADFIRGLRLVRGDQFAALGGVVFADQRLDGDQGLIRVTEVATAVGVGELHALDHPVQVGRAVVSV